MKKHLIIVPAIILFLISCKPIREISDQDVVFKIGQDLQYKYSDIALYDSSTHILYFKDNHPEFDTITHSTFTFLAEGEEVYSGSFWPSYLNSLPSGPYISSSPSFYQKYALRIQYASPDSQADPRNDRQLMLSLKTHNLLHSGLTVEINPPSITGMELSFSFTVTNKDIDALLILDPDKTGPNLYQYFTNGLAIKNLTYDVVFSSNIAYETPSPWNGWKPEWLSLLEPGESKTFTINYTMDNPISPGDYIESFEFPGLEFQVSKDDLFQDAGRIWLGNIFLNKKITTQ